MCDLLKAVNQKQFGEESVDLFKNKNKKATILHQNFPKHIGEV